MQTGPLLSWVLRADAVVGAGLVKTDPLDQIRPLPPAPAPCYLTGPRRPTGNDHSIASTTMISIRWMIRPSWRFWYPIGYRIFRRSQIFRESPRVLRITGRWRTTNRTSIAAGTCHPQSAIPGRGPGRPWLMEH